MSKIKNTVQNFFVNSIRVILKGLINVCYRVRKENLDVPKTGRLLLVGNHVSYLDAVLLSLKIKRPIRFIV
ncbi:1-acyl-sn-glycerol-3-phosphate acyltransferase, partial [Vibrio parahaemolyticus]